MAVLPRQSRLITLPCPDPPEHEAKPAESPQRTQSPLAVQTTHRAASPQQKQLSPGIAKGPHTVPPIPPRRRRMVSPGAAETLIGACAAPSYSPSSGVMSPRSESPCGAPCSSYTSYSDMKWRNEDGGGDVDRRGGVLVQPMLEYRDMVRSKTLKEFHSDDSQSDCSESSTIANRSQDSPLIFAHPLPGSGMHPSVSMHALREKTTSPKFYLPPDVKPPTERVSSPSSSSDSSHNGVSKELVFSSHRPSPPIDLFIPSRDLSDSLSRKLATKLSFEPLPAFELEAAVNKSVQDEPPPKIQCRSFSERTFEDRSNARSVHKSDTISQSKLNQCNVTDSSDLSYTHANSSNGTQGTYSNGNMTSSNISNGNTLAQSHVTSHSMRRGASIQNGATETNGYHSCSHTDHSENRFQVPKTPEKPLRTLLSKHQQYVLCNQVCEINFLTFNL